MNIYTIHSVLNILFRYSIGKGNINTMNLPPTLLTAAREEFAANGYKATSIATIAKRAGIAVGSVYLHCNSKYELFREVYKETNAQQRQQLLANIDWSDPKAALMTFLERINAAVHNDKILAEWFSDNPGAKIREDTECNSFFIDAAQVDEWRNKKIITPDISNDVLYELLDAISILDKQNVLSMEAMMFLIRAILNEVFPEQDK